MKKQSRGGAINYQKGTTDVEHLTDVLSKYVKENGPFNVFEFGEYNSLSSNHAVRGTALAKIGPFVLCLLKVRPDACMIYSDLKCAFNNVFLKFPDVVTGKHKDVQTLAGDVSDRCMVILKHARSLALGDHADTIWKRCTANVPHYLMTVLNEIKDTITNSDGQSSFAGCNTKKARTLEAHDSAVSVDDMGLPTLTFAGGAGKQALPISGDSLSKQAEGLGIVPPTKLLLKESMGITKKPAAANAKAAAKSKSLAHGKAIPALKAIAKPKTASSNNACIVDQVVDKESLKLHGPFKAQSYITHMKPPKLVVACTHKQSANHFKVLEQVMMFIKKTAHCSKKAAVAQRDNILANSK